METVAHAPAASPEDTSRKPSAALALGIISLATGFLAVPLLGAVTAITLASLTFQEIDAGLIPERRRGNAKAGMICGIIALCVWIPVFVAVAIAES